MPLTPKGEKIKAAMDKEYGGQKKGDEVFYASRNAGKITGVEDDFGGSTTNQGGAPAPMEARKAAMQEAARKFLGNR